MIATTFPPPIVGNAQGNLDEHGVDRRIAARWTPALASGGYTPVVSAFLEHYTKLGQPHANARGLNSSEAMFVIQLVSFKWTADAPFPTTKKLAKRMGLSQRQVREMGRRLEGLGLLHRKRLSISSANRWDLQPLFEQLEDLVDAQNDNSDDAPTSEVA